MRPYVPQRARRYIQFHFHNLDMFSVGSFGLWRSLLGIVGIVEFLGNSSLTLT